MRAQSAIEEAEVAAEQVRASSRVSSARYARPPSMGVPEFAQLAQSIRSTHSTPDGRRTRTSQTCVSQFGEEDAENSQEDQIKSIKVFTKIKINDAPRMYYK